MVDSASLIGYILSRTGCLHPFRISRLIGLAEIYSLRETGRRLTDLVYRGFNNVFYIEGFKEVVEENQCFKIREGDPSRNIRGCIEYICEEPVLNEEVKQFIDKAINDSQNLSDEELNNKVVNDPLFKKLLETNQ